jgi:hypothetical protein
MTGSGSFPVADFDISGVETSVLYYSGGWFYQLMSVHQ